MSQIVLASGSPRRKELLEQIGIEFEICKPQGEEIITHTKPEEVVMELSKQKGHEVASMVASFGENHEDIMTKSDLMVLAADTVVAYSGHILGKPKDREDAFSMLSMLQGKIHSVFTGVTIVLVDKEGKAGELVFYEETTVTMHPMSEEEINRYLDTGDADDKAGSYGIQGPFAIHIKQIDGDYNNVVGFPISRIYQELKNIGIDWYLW